MPARAVRRWAAFEHYEQSLRVVDTLERDGKGLNLTEQVRDGIAATPAGPVPATLEGRIVRMIDRVAYINHDIDDALRAGLLRPGDFSRRGDRVLGESGSARIERSVHDLVEHSEAAGAIVQGEAPAGRWRRCVLHVRTRLSRARSPASTQDRASSGPVRPLLRPPRGDLARSPL